MSLEARVVSADPDGPADALTLACPFCDAAEIVEVDVARRDNPVVGVDAAANVVRFGPAGSDATSPQWEREQFLCAACGETVDLPAGWKYAYAP